MLRIGLVAGVYLLGGVLSIATGLIVRSPAGQSATVWLPPGIALAALLLWGKRNWPGVFLGGIVLDTLMGYFEAPTAPWTTLAMLTLLICSGSVIQAVVSCALVRRYADATLTLDQPRTVLRFLLCSACASAISSAVGSWACVLLDVRRLENLPREWASWWVSDTISVFLVTPVILAWVAEPSHIWRPRRVQLSVPLLVTLVLVAVAFLQATRLEADRARNDFEQLAGQIAAGLSEELDAAREGVHSVRDFIDFSAALQQRRALHSFASRLRDRNPGLALMAWVPRVPASEREHYEAEQRLEGQNDFSIYELDALDNPLTAGDRAEYFPIQLAEPETAASRIVGLDIGSLEDHAGVLEEGRRTRLLTISEPAALTAFTHDLQGVWMVLPTQQPGGELRGFVICAIRIGDLMRQVLSASAAADLDVELTDPLAPAAVRRMFSTTTQHVPDHRLLYRTRRGFQPGGRHWELDVRPTEAYQRATSSAFSAAVSAVGLAFSALLCGFLLVTTGRSANVQRLVTDRTRELSQSERELKAHREQLEDLVRERTAELEVAKAAAEEANRAKSLFLANMSHELRTPMHAVLAYARLGLDRQPPPKLTQFLKRIVDSGERLLLLLNDLLDLSKLEAGKMQIDAEAHDLEQLMREVSVELEPLLATKKLRLELERSPDCPSCIAQVDRKLVTQLFHNILANAVRFSSEGGRLRARFAYALLPANDAGPSRPALEIAISDEGIGIPEDELELIFDKFVQSSKTRTNAGGTGLGLAICRQIVELHRGNVRARNNAERGATFLVTLPRQVRVEFGAGEAA